MLAQIVDFEKRKRSRAPIQDLTDNFWDFVPAVVILGLLTLGVVCFAQVCDFTSLCRLLF